MDKNQVLDLLVSALAEKAQPSGTPSTPYLHGPGGLFGVSGLEREIISTRVQPMGLGSKLPAFPSDTTNPMYGFLTGFDTDSGSEPSGVCDDCVVAGPMKSCTQTAVFGRKCVATRELEVNRVGQRIDRGEFMDLTVLNDPLASELGGIFPMLPAQDQVLAGREMLARMIEAGVSVTQWLSQKLWSGNPTNNTAGGGYKEFPGLGILVGTTKVDVLSNTDCPSLDSDVKNFNYRKVDDSTTPDIVRVIAEIFRQLKHNASRMNFGTTQFVLVGREDLFYELTAVWPCRYMTDRCGVDVVGEIAAPTIAVLDGIKMRDEMRNGHYLVVDGVKYPYIVDDGIAEYSSDDTNKISVGCFSSDLYILPLTVRGGVPVLFWQYFDYSKGPMSAVNDGRLGNYFWSDSGRYLWTYGTLKWCVQHSVKIEPRIILRTPHLAGRVTNIQYCPLQHSRDSFTDQDYFVDGGVKTPRPAPSLYSEWDGSQR